MHIYAQMLLFLFMVTVNLLMTDFLDAVLEEVDIFDKMLNSHSPMQTCIPLAVSMAFQNSYHHPSIETLIEVASCCEKTKRKNFNDLKMSVCIYLLQLV